MAAVLYPPHDLLVEILSRLPATSLVSLRYACKAWHAITRDPFFVDLHRRRATAASCKSRASYLFVPKKPVVTHLSYELATGGATAGGGDGDGGGGRIHLTSVPLFQQETNSGSRVSLNSHCRGLTCLSLLRGGEMTISVHNLATGEYRVLRTLPRDPSFSFQLGFDRRTKRYKLLFLDPLLEWDESYDIGICMKPVRAEVYTLGDGPRAWRRLTDYHFPIRTHCTFTNCNGNPLWLRALPDGSGTQVVCFDTAEEKFFTRAGPRKGALEAHEWAVQVFTWWEDTLSMVIYSQQRFALDFWVLTDEEENAWSMQWRIPLEDPDTFWSIYKSVVGPLPGGEMMFMTFRGLVTVSPSHGGLRRLKLPLNRKRVWPVVTLPHVGTLVSLQDLWDEGQADDTPGQADDTLTELITTEECKFHGFLGDVPRYIFPALDYLNRCG